MGKIGVEVDSEKEISKDLLEFLYVLSEDKDFQAELDSIIENIYQANFDLSKVKNKIMRLINKFLAKMSYKEEVKDLLKALEENEEMIENTISEMAVEIMMDRSMGVYAGVKNLKEFLESESSKLLKKTMRRFIVYEIYKMLNPRRVAGQTKLENFISNFILRGEKVARKFEGGSDEEIRRYGSQLLKKLRLIRSKFLKSGGKGVNVRISK